MNRKPRTGGGCTPSEGAPLEDTTADPLIIESLGMPAIWVRNVRS
jgi:hypothetical protein